MKIGELPVSDHGALEASLEQRRLLVDEALRWLTETGSASAVAGGVGDSLQAPAKRVQPILIDATGGAEADKDVGQDVRKTTFVSFSGVEGARQLAQELIEASQEAVAPFGSRARLLRDLARYVVTRRR